MNNVCNISPTLQGKEMMGVVNGVSNPASLGGTQELRYYSLFRKKVLPHHAILSFLIIDKTL